MRTVLPFLVAGFVAAQALFAADRFSAQDLLALEGEAFLKAADDIGYDLDSFSVTELAAIAEKVRIATKDLPKNSKYRESLSRFFYAACAKTRGAELASLVEIYTALEPGSFDKNLTFHPLAVAWILHEIDSRRDWPTIELPELKQPLPDQLKDAPKELIEAWQLFQRSKQTTERSSDAGQPKLSSQTNERAFGALIDQVLLKQGDHPEKELAMFYRNNTASVGIFMALLSGGRIPEAFGAVVELESKYPLITEDGKKGARVEFLKKCGVDWEAILAGAQVDAELGSGWATDHASCLNELAQLGSDRAASLLVQMAARAKPPMHEAYAYTLSAFFPRDADRPTYTSRMIERQRDLPAISFELQTRIIDILQDFAKPEANSELVEAALDGLGRAKSLRTKPTLRALLKHPSGRVMAEAARILGNMGESVEILQNDLARFQIIVNGTPAPAGLKVSWDVEVPSGRSVHDTTDTNDIGVIGVPREHLLHAQQAGGKLTISSTNVISPPEAPSYLVTVPLPKNLDETTRVEVQVWPVELRVLRTKAIANDNGAKALVRLERHEVKGPEDSSQYTFFDQMEKEFETPLGTPLHLSLQRGSYDVKILASGAAHFEATLDARPNAPVVKAHLNPGGDVRFEIVRPSGERDAEWWVLRKGKKIQCAGFTENTCRGLPAGEYALHIPSTAELKSIAGNYFETVLQPFMGRDVPFTISEEVPLVDLGEIHLDPAK